MEKKKSVLTLKVYEDDTLEKVEKEYTAEKIKIPYRVGLSVIKSLDEIDLDDEMEILQVVTGNVDKLDKIVKATFHVRDEELERVDMGELISTIKELYSWVMEKTKQLGGNEKNVETTE